MDERTATLTLTEILQKNGYTTIVVDSAIKHHLIESSKSIVLDFGYGDSQIVDFNGVDISQRAGRNEAYSYFKNACPAANYLFAQGNNIEQSTAFRNSLITPIAIIGKAEKRILETKFYKNVPSQVCEALEFFKIPNYVDTYETYCSLHAKDIDKKLDIHKIFRDNNLPTLYKPFKAGDTVEIGDIIQGRKSHNFYIVNSVEEEEVHGRTFKDPELKIPHGTDDYEVCKNQWIIPIYKRLNILPEFIQFVLSLPKEDQDINSNEIILQSISNPGTLAKILSREYIKGENFARYFNAINENAQEETVNTLKLITDRNSYYDLFLWNKGFKETTLDYMELYRKEDSTFIEYFKIRSPQEKKIILKDIMNCDYTNKLVAEWLDENELDLLREVSMDG